MAQHHREIISPHPHFNDQCSAEIHHDSVSETVSVDGGTYTFDAYKIAAAIIEGLRYRGQSIDEQFQMIRDQIAEWDANGDNS